MLASKTTFTLDEYVDMGEGYHYRKMDSFGVEIRHFVMDLDGDISKQVRLVDTHDINGLALKFKCSKIEDIEKQYRLACEILEKLGHRLLMLLLFRFEILETLDILDFTPNLKKLGVHCKLKKSYDFTKLSELEELDLWYGKKFSSVFECKSIKKLQIFKMDEYAVQNISKLHQLEDLWIRQTSLKSIDGMCNLKNLKKLRFNHLYKLETISSIQECKKIAEISFDCCKKVTDWELIGKLPNLTKLYIENCGILNNINFLKTLENLESVVIGGENMKLVDGNVRWLYEKQPKLKRICLPWRKDFDISKEEWREYL